MERPHPLFGLVVGETRDSVWVGDPAVDHAAVDEAIGAAYRKSGGAAHVLPMRPGVDPLRLRYRPMTALERAVVMDLCGGTGLGQARDGQPFPWARHWYYCAAVGLDLPDVPDEVEAAGGVKVAKRIQEGPVRMLSSQVMDGIVRLLGMSAIVFYGRAIYSGSTASADDVFQSRPSSTVRTSGPSGTPSEGRAATPAPKANGSGVGAQTAPDSTPNLQALPRSA